MTAIVTTPPIYFNAKKYQCACDGVTDDTTNLTTAITAASSGGGGRVFLPGLCAISTPITLPTNVQLVGAGFGTGLQPLASFSGAQIVLCNGANSGVLDMQIGFVNTTYSSNPAANGIQVTGVQRVLLQNLFIQFINGWAVQSTGTTGQANTNFVMSNVRAVSGAQGFHSLGVTGSAFNGTQRLTNCSMTSMQGGDAYLFEDITDIIAANIFGSVTAGSGNAIHIKGACTNIYIENVDIGTAPGPSTGSTVLIETGSNGTPTQVGIRGGVIQGGTAGTTISAGTQLQVTDCQITNNGTYGINITGGDAIEINDCTFSLNGSAGTTGRYDFQSSTANHVEVTDCYFNTAQGTTAQKTNNAVNVTAGNVVMRGCSFYGTGYNATNIFNNYPSSIINCPGYGALPVVPFALYDGDLSSNTTGAVVANTAYLVGVELKVPATLTGIRVRWGTGGNGFYDTGIYDATGTNAGPGSLLAHAAATNTSLATATGVTTPALIAGARSLVGGNLPLEPGRYWLAVWASNALDTLTKQGAANTNMTIVQTGTNAGPLPAAASSLTGLANANFKPIIIGILQNGWT